jgi:hypothetical protein
MTIPGGPAQGIHDHPEFKLGKRPPVNRPTVDVSEFFAADFFATVEIPAHPESTPIPSLTYPMDRNDIAGDCVVASTDHALRTIAASLGVPRTGWDDATLLRYYQTQNPGFQSWTDGGGPHDEGMIIQDFLNYLVNNSPEIVAFGRIDHRNEDLFKAASYVGLAIVTGVELRVAQQRQSTTWDWVDNSAIWGGHAIATFAYDPDTHGIATWGRKIRITDTFVSRQMDEAWLILTPDMLTHPDFRNSFDLAGFANSIFELTDGKVVVPVPDVPPTPDVPPAPVPVPPADVLADFPAELVRPWVGKPRSWTKSMAAARAVEQWGRKHGAL